MRWMSIIAAGLAFLSMSCGASQPTGLNGPHEADAPLFLRVAGDKVLDSSGNPILLKGVAFGNQVWQDKALPNLHHSEVDYRRLAEMGMNSVRFYLHYITFEDDAHPGVYKEAGWRWLDQNVAWAKKHGVYLVLNMHVPPGGYQSQGKGKALWEDRAAQKRFIELWQAIAKRYRNEPTIAGYDLLNEPVVTRTAEQWRELAERTVQAVRMVDPHHILFIERVNAVAGDWKEDAERNFFKVNDPNVVYEFHFYKPFHFTHQGAPWVDFVAEKTTYPDPNRVGVEWFLTDWRGATFDSPKLARDDSDWTYYEGAWFKVDDPNLAMAKPTLVCQRNSGKAYFDDIVLEKMTTEGSDAEEIWRVNLTTNRGFYFWKADGDRDPGTSALETTGHGDDASLSISGTTGDATLSADIHMIRIEPGASYRLSGWMKGEKIPEEADCQIRLDFWSTRVPLHGWDKGFLTQELEAYFAWGRKHNVPLYLGEFGIIKASFEEGRGGLSWVSDMLDILLEKKIHFAYHDYHEVYFGLYFGDHTLPDPNNANTPLIDLFKTKLGGGTQ